MLFSQKGLLKFLFPIDLLIEMEYGETVNSESREYERYLRGDDVLSGGAPDALPKNDAWGYLREWPEKGRPV